MRPLCALNLSAQVSWLGECSLDFRGELAQTLLRNVLHSVVTFGHFYNTYKYNPAEEDRMCLLDVVAQVGC
jgi:hypothetical protein